MKISPLVIIAVLVPVLFVAGVWFAPTQTKEQTRSVSVPVSTYNSLVQFGDTNRSPAGEPMSVAQVINVLILAGEDPTACVAP